MYHLFLILVSLKKDSSYTGKVKTFRVQRHYQEKADKIIYSEPFYYHATVLFFLSKTLFLFIYLANTSVNKEETHYTKELDVDSGEITPLEYPCNYSNNANYTWIIKTKHNKTSVNFTILDLQAETNGIWSCSDYLQVC